MPRLLASSNGTRTTTRMELRRLTHIVASPMKECPKRLWLELYRRELSTNAIGGSAGFTAGGAVGSVARKRKT